MAAPEEGHRVEALASPQDVARRGLPLPLGDDPVLDADALPAPRVGVPCDVACGEDPRCARLEVLVDEHATLYREAGPGGQLVVRAHADARDDQIGKDPLPAAE